MDKAAGYTVKVILPSSVSCEKFYKKLTNFLPKGTNIVMKPNDLTLQDDRAPEESRLDK